jgi:hypothetical protein
VFRLALRLIRQQHFQRRHSLVEPESEIQFAPGVQIRLRLVERRVHRFGRLPDRVLHRLIVLGEIAGVDQQSDDADGAGVEGFGVVETLLVGSRGLAAGG